MASALLASRNEPCWGDRTVYMRKNPNPKLCPNPNPNFNSITNDHEADNQNPFQPMESDEPAALRAAGAAVSDDSSCFNRKPADLVHRRDTRGHVTFSISAYSKQELRELKRRLISELEQIRSVASRIESREVQPSFRSAACSASSAQGGGREVSTAVLPVMARSDTVARRLAPDANQPYHPADIKKRRPVADARAGAPELKKLHTAMMKKCSQILTKLMKHKGGVWFNTPVDIIRLGIHDYHQIIKNPMDLGTVKSKLVNGVYTAPLDFASDVRLTFSNALAYNPQGHVVHSIADLLLRQFEDSFGPAYGRYEKQQSAIVKNCSRFVEPAMRTEPSRLVQQRPAMTMPEQPKQKANGADKRAMSMVEKQKLGDAIQNLPDDKMMEVLQIVSKRNVTERNGDEVEIDFELMDNETLWELDRFVGKVRKQREEAVDEGHSSQDHPLAVHTDAGKKSLVAEAVAVKKMRKGEPVEEEVDIGDEMPANHYPPVEIGRAASSSGSDSSSSSGSESESSSGRSNTEDEARSPAVDSRRSPTKLTTGR